MANSKERITALRFWEMCAADAMGMEVFEIICLIESWNWNECERDIVVFAGSSGYEVVMTDYQGKPILSQSIHDTFMRGSKIAVTFEIGRPMVFVSIQDSKLFLSYGQLK